MNVDRANLVHLNWSHISMDRWVQARNAIEIFVMDVGAVAADDDDEMHSPSAAATGIDCLQIENLI